MQGRGRGVPRPPGQGVYQIEITGADGGHVYSGRKHIGDIADTEVEAQNVLNVDLSSVMTGPVEPGGGTNLASGKKTKAQQELIRQEMPRVQDQSRDGAVSHGGGD